MQNDCKVINGDKTVLKFSRSVMVGGTRLFDQSDPSSVANIIRDIFKILEKLSR